MSTTGLAYLHPRAYSAIMRVLHWGAFDERYQAVARHVPEGASVVDLCCGDAALASYLPAGVPYLGLDANERFVRHARKQGLGAQLWDATSDPIPTADVIVIQASLYQFHPDDGALIDRAFGAAKSRLIIAEPVINWTTHGTGWQKFLARRMTRVGGRRFDFRHDEASLRSLVSKFDARHFELERAGRDLVIVIHRQDVGNVQPSEARV